MTNSQIESAIVEKIMQKFRSKNIEIKRTLRGILWEKFLDKIEKESSYFTFRHFIEITLCVISLFAIIYPERTMNLCVHLFKLEDYVIPKSVITIVLIFSSRKIFIYFKEVYIKCKKCVKTLYIENDLINGIPINELLDHLFIFKSFKRDDIEQKFKIPRRKYESLAKKLENLGIIYKDKNKKNARILSSDVSRSDIVKILNQGDNEESSPTPSINFNCNPIY